MNYEKSQNETENLSADELKLRELCRSLKKTDAPHDFDFKLKARIANAAPSDYKPRYGFALRYALPALAVILVLGLLAFNGAFYSPGNDPSIAAGSVAPQNSASSASPQNTAVSNSVPAPFVKEPESVATLSNTDVPQTPERSQPQVADARNPKKDLRREKKDSGGGSKVLSLKPNEQFRFNSNSVVPKPQNIEQANPMPVKDVLSQIGVDADLENGKWKVKSVRANSIGESSNIKENDVIESIDNQSLSPQTVFTKTVKGNTVTVTRNGAKLQIDLRGKQ